MTRSEIDAYTQFVAHLRREGPRLHQGQRRAKGREGLQSPIVKNLHDAAHRRDPRADRCASNGDLIFFGADKAKVVNDAIGALRNRIGHSEFGRRTGLLESGLAAALGHRLPDVRVRRGGCALGRVPPSVHVAEGRSRELPRGRSRPLPRQGLRHGAQRLGDRRRLGADPPRGGAEQGVPGAEHRRGRGAREVRFPARRAAVRRAAPRRHRLRPGPHRHDDDRRRIDPRRDRLPQDAARAVPADAGAVGGRREAAARAAHPAAAVEAAKV